MPRRMRVFFLRELCGAAGLGAKKAAIAGGLRVNR